MHDLRVDELRTGAMKHLRLAELRKFFHRVNVRPWPDTAAQADDLPSGPDGWAVDYTMRSEACAGDVPLVSRTEGGNSERPTITHVVDISTSAKYDRLHTWATGYLGDLRTLLKLPRPVPRLGIAADAALAPGSYFKAPSPLEPRVLDYWPVTDIG